MAGAAGAAVAEAISAGCEVTAARQNAYMHHDHDYTYLLSISCEAHCAPLHGTTSIN